MTGVLRVEGLVVGYGGIRVLNGVNVEVQPGQIVGLLGPNGAGKTTLLRTIAGFLRPWSGRIHLDDRDISRDSVARRARNGMCVIPEGRAIFTELTVSENIAVHAQKRRPDDAIKVVSEAFPVLRQRLKQQAGTMSGGEQQMLAVARSLVRRSPLVIADELSFGLGPIVVDKMLDALAKMREMGSSV